MIKIGVIFHLGIVRKLSAILLFAIFLFNICGYKLLFSYEQQQSDKQLESSLDKQEYNEEDLIAIKVPLSIPYQNNQQNFERVDGEITINGKILKYSISFFIFCSYRNFKLFNMLIKSKSSPFSTLSILRISIGIIYLWFGSLKFFYGYSAAEVLASKTIERLTFGVMSNKVEVVLLATVECFIGVLLISGNWLKPVLILLFAHMLCTFTPFFLFPQDTFRNMPYELSLTGQYIVKNLVIISAGLVLWQNEKEKSDLLVQKTYGKTTNSLHLKTSSDREVLKVMENEQNVESLS